MSGTSGLLKFGAFKSGLPKAVMISVLIITMLSFNVCQSSSASQNSTSIFSDNLILKIYIDDSGRSLVTGYADGIKDLPFLKASQYKYDNDTKQLYAITNSLTFKSGDDWFAKLSADGNYSEYHSTFYLPSSIVLSKINSSQGLEYLVSASNESFVVDVHGYDVKSPDIIIDYQEPLSQNAASPGQGETPQSYILPILAMLGLILAGAFFWMRRGHRANNGSTSPSPPLSQTSGPGEPSNGSTVSISQASIDMAESGSVLEQEPEVYVSDADNREVKPLEPVPEPSGEVDKHVLIGPAADVRQPLSESTGPISEKDSEMSGQTPEPEELTTEVARAATARAAEVKEKEIEITSEMAAVMETLTARERSVLKALIDHSGRMTQADIRFETKIPKSSLTGIILSLERRKLVIKKEWGRTNIIELSDWFLSKKERS